jgi:hypothetical protein
MRSGTPVTLKKFREPDLVASHMYAAVNWSTALEERVKFRLNSENSRIW